MEFAKKFILVPNDQFSKHVPNENNLSDLDREMNAILTNKNIKDDQKVKLYMQVLQKRLHILEHNNGLIPETATEPENNLPIEEDSIEEMIMESAPKNFKSNTRNILNYFKKSRDVMNWTSNGEFVYKGHIIKNSNILDLIKSIQISSNKHILNGQDEFRQGLMEINFPKSFIKNSFLKEEPRMKKEDIIPVKKTTRNQNKDVSTPDRWISLKQRRGIKKKV